MVVEEEVEVELEVLVGAVAEVVCEPRDVVVEDGVVVEDVVIGVVVLVEAVNATYPTAPTTIIITTTTTTIIVLPIPDLL